MTHKEMMNIKYKTIKDRIDKRKWDFYKCLGFSTKAEAEKALKELK